jgi:NAD(P)-dependent dehydrogenase (short-subunit alcohol dehydrogenase family)
MSTESRTGRVALITGASSGIGEAATRALAADGYRSRCSPRHADRIHALADELGDGALLHQGGRHRAQLARRRRPGRHGGARGRRRPIGNIEVLARMITARLDASR